MLQNSRSSQFHVDTNLKVLINVENIARKSVENKFPGQVSKLNRTFNHFKNTYANIKDKTFSEHKISVRNAHVFMMKDDLYEQKCYRNEDLI